MRFCDALLVDLTYVDKLAVTHEIARDGTLISAGSLLTPLFVSRHHVQHYHCDLPFYPVVAGKPVLSWLLFEAKWHSTGFDYIVEK